MEEREGDPEKEASPVPDPREVEEGVVRGVLEGGTEFEEV